MSAVRAPKGAITLLRLLTKLERWIVIAAFSTIVLVIFLDVANREVIGPILKVLGFDAFSGSLFWSHKIALFALIVAAFVSLGVSIGAGGQIVPRIGATWMPISWGRTVDRISFAVSGLVMATAAYFAAVFVASTFGLGTLISGTGWSAWTFQIVAPFGFATASVRYGVYALWPETAPVPDARSR